MLHVHVGEKPPEGYELTYFLPSKVLDKTRRLLKKSEKEDIVIYACEYSILKSIDVLSRKNKQKVNWYNEGENKNVSYLDLKSTSSDLFLDLYDRDIDLAFAS